MKEVFDLNQLPLTSEQEALIALLRPFDQQRVVVIDETAWIHMRRPGTLHIGRIGAQLIDNHDNRVFISTNHKLTVDTTTTPPEITMQWK